MQFGFVLLFSLLCGLSWALGWEVSLGAGEWLWAIKKMQVIYREKWRSLSNWSEHSQAEFWGEGREGGIGYNDEYACAVYSCVQLYTDVSKSACNAVEYRCVFTVFLPFLHLGMFFKPQATSPLCECSHRWIHTKIHRHQLHHLPPTMSTHTSAPSTTTTTSLTKKKTKKTKPQAQSLWDDLISNDIWKRPHRANKIKLRPCLFSVLEIC